MDVRNKRVAILTLGCRANQSESSVIEGTLRQHGVSIVGIDDAPDCCIVNTCTVTGKSDANSRQLIRKASKTGAEIIVTGCYSELNRSRVLEMSGVRSVVPIDRKNDIIGQVIGSDDIPPLYNLHGRARPLLKVQDGCNFNCSYCAVPLARGRSRSIEVRDAVARARAIEEEGYMEVVLTGIHLGSYGQDLNPKADLAHLVSEILRNTDRMRIRLSSIEINEVDDALLELLMESRVCNHLHLPLQHGSDRILKLMNRNYSSGSFEKKVGRIFDMNSDVAIGIDIIAGFPTETGSDHKMSMSLVENLPISYMHVFPYSVRPGTVAADLKPQLSSKLTGERAASLRALGNAKKRAYASEYIGKTLDIIIEEEDDNGTMVGTSSNYLRIQMNSNCAKRGSLVFITLHEASDISCRGVLIA